MGFAALDHVEQAVAIEHLARVLEKGEQQAELGRGDRDHRAIGRGQPPLQGIEPPALELEQFVFGRRRRALGRPAQDRTDPCDQLARVERFDHVIVGADLQPDDPVGRLALGRQQDHRDRERFADMAAQRQPVLARHHDVEQDQVGQGLAQTATRFGRAARLDHGKPLAREVLGQGFA